MFRNDTIESEADRRRKVSRPAVTDGKLRPAIMATSATTISASSRVMPVVVLFIRPALDVGIGPIAAGLSVGAQRNNVGILAVIAGKLVFIRTATEVHRNLLGHVRAGPIGQIAGIDAPRLQTLRRGRVDAGD